MCGIAGIVTWRPDTVSTSLLTRMITPLKHRGPDDHGVWMDNECGVGLGHRRLSIIDLSPEGHQPMVSASGRYVLAYNGEIYNFCEIRDELVSAGKAPAWRGHSDTEVLLAAIEAWGIERALQRIVGMYAIALWDRAQRELTLARDRIGEKPLYYGVVRDQLLFASELKSIQAVAAASLEVDRSAVVEFMRFGYIPSPGSIYRGIYKLSPGHLVTLRSPSGSLVSDSYWSLDQDEMRNKQRELEECSDSEIIDQVHNSLRNAVGLQMAADVPLGAFLSGGVDSSTIVALMQDLSPNPVRTFTIGFNEGMFNEAPYASAVAKHLGTEHTELYVTAADAADVIPQLPGIYDEPFADSSQIPTTLVSRLTRQHVTVSLSGDGGDELFEGYQRYEITASLWRRIFGQPMILRRGGARFLQSLSAQSWDRLLSILPASQRRIINGRRISRMAQLIQAESVGEMYVRLMSQWQPEEGVVLGGEPDFILDNWAETEDAKVAMRRWDLGQYLPDDLLVKVDRASMSASLESRAPLLDHRVVELAFSLPQRMLVRDGVGKWVLRNVLYRYVPKDLIEREKAGFAVPLGEWLRGPLRDWAETLLSSQVLRGDGFFAHDKILTLWSQHLDGSYDRSTYLWNVLMFQAWLQATKEGIENIPVDTELAT